MSSLFFVINHSCDIACTYCFYTIGHEHRSGQRIHPKDIRFVADKLSQLRFDTVILTGGDPLQSRLKAETYVLIAELKRQRIEVIVNTSGALLEEADLDKLIGLGVDRIDFSIDSHNPAVHDAQRGRYADTVRAIQGLIARGYTSVVTTTVVTERNAPTLATTLRWLRSLGVADVRVQKVFEPNRATQDGCTSGRTNDKLIIGAMRAAGTEARSSHFEHYLELTAAAFLGEEASHRAICQMGKSYFVCSPDGALTGCFHREDVLIGNLFTDSVETIECNMIDNSLAAVRLPSCFGKHCVALFDNPRFWRNRQ